MLLATRYRRPDPIILGILVATLANHALASLRGAQAAAFLDSPIFLYAVGASFIAMASWTLVPDKLAEVDARQRSTEHTSALQSLMRISYAVFCLKKKTKNEEIIHATLHHTDN